MNPFTSFQSLVSVTALCAVIITTAQVFAQDLEPKSYANVPIGVNSLVAGYGYSQGGVASDPALPLQNAHVRTNGTFLAYARTLDICGTSGKFDVVLPYAWVSGSADFQGEPRERSVSGCGDPRLRFAVNFWGAPALQPQQFAEYRQDLIIGGSLQVTAPLGRYDADKLLNIGTNRWAVRPQLGMSKALGPFMLELATGITFFSDNNDFLGGKTLAQNPVYSMQGHLIYGFRPGAWVAISGNYYTGGRTTIDGVKGDNLQQNSRVSVTASLPVDRRNSVRFYASTGIVTRSGSDFNNIGVAWQYRWGEGL